MTTLVAHSLKESVWVVIPAYKEAAIIGTVVADVARLYPNVIVVDDASADETPDAAARSGALVVRHPINLGQGAALQTGIDFALERGAQFIVTFDADGQHHASDIPALIEPLHDGRADFALGSRFLGRTLNMPSSRRLLLQAALLFTRITTRLRITDAHNGLRAMTRRGAQAIHIRQNRMAHASEIVEQIARSRLAYVEVPVTIEYTDYSLAKGQRMSNSLSILVDLFAGRLQR
jgi:glycosyltransferase involved in cell wall biosynthesis